MEKNYKNSLYLWVAAGVMLAMTGIGRIRIESVYRGLGFGANTMYHFFYFAFFFVHTLYLFGDAEQYFSGYGILTVSRYRNRGVLFFHCIIVMLKKILLFHFISIISGTLFTALLFKERYMINTHVVQEFLLFLLTDIALAFLQILLEIMINARMALLIMGGYYIFSLFFARAFFYMPFMRGAIWILIPNLAMHYRIDSYQILPVQSGIYLLSLLVLFIAIGSCMIKRKDIL